ncbi:hypothetical protein FRX31_017155 [Thalictrum thalictroides]|nr:hypothetical protein FRX31_017155 [Thalictrum thalictroides]
MDIEMEHNAELTLGINSSTSVTEIGSANSEHQPEWNCVVIFWTCLSSVTSIVLQFMGRQFNTQSVCAQLVVVGLLMSVFSSVGIVLCPAMAISRRRLLIHAIVLSGSAAVALLGVIALYNTIGLIVYIMGLITVLFIFIPFGKFFNLAQKRSVEAILGALDVLRRLV